MLVFVERKPSLLFDENNYTVKFSGLMRPQADNQKEILMGTARSVHVYIVAT